MPKVLFVAPSAYTLSGLATWLDYVVPGLAEHGWDAELGLVSGPTHHRPQRYLDVHPTDRVRLAHCESGTPEGRRRALEQMLTASDPDIAVSVNVPDLFVTINQRRQSGRPSPNAVLSIHGIEAWLYADALRYREMLDAVVCTNRLASVLTGRLGGVAPDRILYAAYGVDRPERMPADAGGPMRIVYSGRLESSQKRVGDLVDIVRGLDSRGLQFQFDIAGDGPERASLETALAPHCEAGRVVFHGQVGPDRLKRELYSRADAVLITSQWETGPIVAWEAMAQGVPVVSSRYIGSGREGALVDGQTALLFDIGDTDAAADALARLHREDALRSRVIAAADRLLEARYTITASLQAWDAALRAVLSHPRLGAIDLPVGTTSGRLDRIFGPRAAESVRTLLHREVSAAPDPGGEWPHSHSHAPSDAAFWQLAAAADVSAAEEAVDAG